jgi:hypothetical protein
VAALLPGKEPPQYPLCRRLCGPQRQSGCFGEGRILAPAVMFTPDLPGCGTVSTLAMLSSVLDLGCVKNCDSGLAVNHTSHREVWS